MRPIIKTRRRYNIKDINNIWLSKLSYKLDCSLSDVLNACIDFMRYKTNLACDTIDLEYFLPGNETTCIYCREDAFTSKEFGWCPTCGKTFTIQQRSAL